MSTIDLFKKHYHEVVKGSKVESITVDALKDDDGNPLVIYFYPLSTLSLEKREPINKISQSSSNADIAARLLVERALRYDENGKLVKMFRAADVQHLKDEASADLVTDIVVRMTEIDNKHERDILGKHDG
jgi:hypothetical protein